MIIGKMDKRIQLMKPNVIPDGQGGQKPVPDEDEYIPAGKIWSEFKTPSIKELSTLGTQVSEVNQLISIRRHTSVTRGWQVIYKNRVFDILNVFEPDRETTILVCREVII